MKAPSICEITKQAIKHAIPLLDKPSFEISAAFYIGRSLATCAAMQHSERYGETYPGQIAVVVSLFEVEKNEDERTSRTKRMMKSGFFYELDCLIKMGQRGGFSYSKIALSAPHIITRTIIACAEYADGDADGIFVPWRPAGENLIDGKSKATRNKRKFATLSKMIESTLPVV